MKVRKSYTNWWQSLLLHFRPRHYGLSVDELLVVEYKTLFKTTYITRLFPRPPDHVNCRCYDIKEGLDGNQPRGLIEELDGVEFPGMFG